MTERTNEEPQRLEDIVPETVPAKIISDLPQYWKC